MGTGQHDAASTEYTQTKERPRPKRIMVRKDKTNPRRLAYLCLLLFAQPPAWPLLVFGAVLIVAAVSFHGWAAGYLARAGYEERESLLTARGPYRLNRNPYYVAQMTMDLGFFCIAGLPLFYLLYFPIIFSVYRKWVLNEEPFLEEEFGDEYREFKQQVPRWLVRLTPAPGRGHDQRFDWATYKVNKETHRTVSHLVLLCVFIAYYVYGNPFGDVDPWTLLTIVAGIAGWLAVRDVFPLDVSETSYSWLGAASVIAVAGGVFLLNAPLWETWSTTASWIAVSAGILFGLLVAGSTLPAFAPQKEKRRGQLFARPLCQWYVLFMGLGLFTCQLGGVWWAVVLSLVLWAVNLSGVMTVKRLQQHVVSAVIVLVVVAGAASFPVVRLLGSMS